MAKLLVEPLSHSSSMLLYTCQQKFLYYKSKTEKDPDVTPSDSLIIGNSFHYILEKTFHERPESFKPFLDHCIDVGFEDKQTGEMVKLPDQYRCLIHAMILKYLRLHTKSKLKVLACEMEIRTPQVVGYIDAIMEDEHRKWWIVDLKTATYLYVPKLAGLLKDPQLNLYAAHKVMIAKKLKLDLKDFGGCRYRVVTKSTVKRQANETDLDYTKRLLNQYIKAYDVELPAESLEPEERFVEHDSQYQLAASLIRGSVEPKRNYSQCLSWNRPCEYWSRCYGKTHSEISESLRIVSEE